MSGLQALSPVEEKRCAEAMAAALPRGAVPSGRGVAVDEAELEEALEAEAEADEAWQAANDEQAELDALLADDGLGFLDGDEAEFVEYTDEELLLEAPPPGPEAQDAAMLQSATHFNGTFSTFADKSTRGPRVDLSRAKSEAQERSKAAEGSMAHADECWRQEAEETERLKQLHRELQASEDELARLMQIGQRDPNVMQQRAQAHACQAVGAALAAQQELHRNAEGAARQAQLEADGSALARDSSMRRLTELLPIGEAQDRANRVAAPMRAAQERAAAEREVEAARQARLRADGARQEREVVAEQQLTAARVGHRKAVANLRPRSQLVREANEEIYTAQRKQLEKRAEAVLALKTSTEAAQAKLQGANQRRAEKRRALERARESERNAILSAGGNPYQVFREREEQARMRVEQKKVEVKLAENMEAMQQRMLYQARQENKRREEERCAEQRSASRPRAAEPHAHARTHTRTRTHTRAHT